ncbi:hypothetical protein [Saccharothrix saharensis]|nr:hypothetical protein [Saccharothrix saharensis]
MSAATCARPGGNGRWPNSRVACRVAHTGRRLPKVGRFAASTASARLRRT